MFFKLFVLKTEKCWGVWSTVFKITTSTKLRGNYFKDGPYDKLKSSLN